MTSLQQPPPPPPQRPRGVACFACFPYSTGPRCLGERGERAGQHHRYDNIDKQQKTHF